MMITLESSTTATKGDQKVLPSEPDELNNSHMPIKDSASLVRGLQEFISRQPNVFGGADIYSLDYQAPQIRAGMLFAILTGLIGGDNRLAILNFVVVAPPKAIGEDYEAIVWDEMIATYRLISGRELDTSEQDFLRARFSVSIASDRRSNTVLDIIKAQPERTAVIVTEAASYRNDTVDPYIALGAISPLQPEDVWAPQLHALATSAVEIAQERGLYVALDANQLTPHRKALSDLLLSIDACGVMESSSEEAPESILAGFVDRWDEWIRKGYLGRALNDIENLPAVLDNNKPFLCIQMLHRAGFFTEALQAIRENMPHDRHLDAYSRVKYARIAQDANASKLASEILAPAIDQLDNQEHLELALATAHEIGINELEVNIAERLDALFPESPGVLQRRRQALFAKRDYAGLAVMAKDDADGKTKAMYYSKLKQFLSVDGAPNYHALIATANGDSSQADAYRMACVDDALNRNLINHAFQLVMPLPMTPDQTARGEKLLLDVLEAILLNTSHNGELPVSRELFVAAMLSLIERLAADPEKLSLRVKLAQLIHPSVAGTTGMAIMAFIVINLASKPILIKKRRTLGKANATWFLDNKSFVDVGFNWMKGEEPVVIGKLVMPESLLTVSADEAVSAAEDYFSHAPLEAEEDIVGMNRWLALTASITHHSSDTDADLRLMRHVANRYVSAGYNQHSRDLVERILLNSNTSPRRRRLGWFAMADVYHRGRNLLEGLLAIACTLAADGSADEDQVWYETNTIARLLRDCGLHDPTLSFIERSRQLLQDMELFDSYSHQLDTLELQIRQARLLNTASSNAETETLLTDVIKNAKAILKIGGMTEPIAAVLGQLLITAKNSGARIPPESVKIFADLSAHLKGGSGLLVKTLADSTPSADDLFSLLNISGSVRYSDDVGYDMHTIALVASRALTSDEYIESAINASFALELLADRGVAVPEWDESAEPPPAPIRISEPSEIANSISQEGISVVQIGFDASGNLVRVSSIAGHIDEAVREPDDVMHKDRFRRWAEDYPYAYGVDEDTTNLFYTTTADLRLSALPLGPVVVVADASLQPFPPNLFYVDETFAGRERPMAATPSLAWLQAARAKGTIGDGRICAWISIAEGEGDSQTLPMIAGRLQPTFEQYDINVDTGPTLPAEFSGASMAIITAHVGVHPEGRYFQVVSDEGILRVTANDLANALRNVGIVILFVCSGGRADKHPGANTTLGLAKQILDRGCAAVIASPWPLDSRVPSHWLPEFLQCWSQGESIIKANFVANQLVDKLFAQNPAQGLAMTIYGNPEMRRNSTMVMN